VGVFEVRLPCVDLADRPGGPACLSGFQNPPSAYAVWVKRSALGASSWCAPCSLPVRAGRASSRLRVPFRRPRRPSPYDLGDGRADLHGHHYDQRGDDDRPVDDHDRGLQGCYLGNLVYRPAGYVGEATLFPESSASAETICVKYLASPGRNSGPTAPSQSSPTWWSVRMQHRMSSAVISSTWKSQTSKSSG